MAFAQIIDDAPVRVTGGEVQHLADGEPCVTALESIAAWTEGERNAVGIFTIAPHDAAPEGQQVASVTLELFEGGIREAATFEAAPVARRLINKDLVMSRLDEVDLVEVAQAALLRRPVLYGRWFSKDWPEVYADDADMVTLLTAIGADVAAITAP